MENTELCKVVESSNSYSQVQDIEVNIPALPIGGAIAPRPKPTLQTLPQEILSQILRYACTNVGSIKPEQSLPRSSQFAHENPYVSSRLAGIYRHPVRYNGRLPSALTAVELGFTSRLVSKIVREEFFLYKENTFDFLDMKSMLTYLVAILPERRNAIKSIRVQYDFTANCEPAAALTILSACEGLKYLELDITLLARYFNPNVRSFDKVPGYNELVKLRGVEVKLVFGEDAPSWSFIHTVLYNVRSLPITNVIPEVVADLRTEVKLVNEEINKITTVARSPTPLYSVGELQAAADHAKLPSRVFNPPPGQSFYPGAPLQQKKTITAGPLTTAPPETPKEALDCRRVGAVVASNDTVILGLRNWPSISGREWIDMVGLYGDNKNT
ncbi:hypothetical protein VTL71DRAFT_1370 [Oculimacula yallundae]|uniref:F-box domain-containing protein n=1 Tax=Oculimacula yallundae TaxID=86028 RepID=A0ABR4CCF2_9HELO